jgi:hypothetical protein
MKAVIMTIIPPIPMDTFSLCEALLVPYCLDSCPIHKEDICIYIETGWGEGRVIKDHTLPGCRRGEQSPSP